MPITEAHSTPLETTHQAAESSPPLRRRIEVILPRGEAIRNFVYTAALDRIRSRMEVDVISVMPDEALHKLMVNRYDSVMELSEIPERWIVRAIRGVLEMAHGRWLWSEAAQDRWRLRDYEATTIALKVKRILSKAICLPFANRHGLNLLSAIERLCSRSLRTSDYYLDLFRKRRPALVFNGSHVHCRVAIQAVQAAQWLGIPTATFVFSWDNLTSQGRIMLPYNFFLVWSEDMRAQLLELYPQIPPANVFVTGTPQFDFHFDPQYFWTREEFCRRLGLDPERPFFIYTTGMPNYMPEEMRVVEGIADLLGGMEDLGRPQLLVRVYPKDRTTRFDELRRRRNDIVFSPVNWEQVWLTPKPDDVEMYTNTLRHCAAGINISSTVSLELCMFDKPVLNVGYNPPGADISPVSFASYYKFDHYREVVESGAVTVVPSQEEMAACLRRALLEPEYRRDERRALITKMFGNLLDGKSGVRVSEALLTAAGLSQGTKPSA